MAQRISSEDVARLAGVSRSAVSRAYTEGAYIAGETRRKVLAAAEQLGYFPNAIARSLITSRTRIVGIVTATLDNPFYAACLEAIGLLLQEQGLASLVLLASNLDDTDRLLAKLLTYQVDAVILTAAARSSTVSAQCARAGKPVVLLNRYIDADHVTSVVSDNVGGGRDVARHLVQAGYRRIAFISGLQGTSDGRDRMRGFRNAMIELGRADLPVADGFYSHDGAAIAARRLLDAHPPPDAIFCANDVMAAACIDVIRDERGLRIPHDVAVVGYDNSSLARWPAYGITSVDQNIPELARLAVEVLTDNGAISTRNDSAAAGQPVRHLVVPPRLVVRGSSDPRLTAGSLHP